jgi:aminopeptidase N
MHLAFPALVLAAAQAVPVPLTLDRFELDLNVDHENERVEGTARLAVRNVSGAPAAEVPLLLNRLMTVTGAGGLEFSQQVLTFEDDSRLQVDAVTIRLPEPLAPGASRTIAVAYGGHIASYEETGRLYIKDRVSEEYTIVREDAFAFPVLGVPSLARNAGIRRDGFSFDARVTVARGFAVAAGGFANRVESAAGTTYRFESRGKAPFLNLCIARFRTLEGKGFTLSYLPGDEAGARTIARRTEEALALLTKWFGPPPDAPALALVEIPSGWGSQADRISGIILAADSFRDPSRLYELYHELAHLWNPPDLDRPSPRWNEGLSMWLQQVVAETLEGAKASTERPVASVLASPDGRLKSVPFASYGVEGMTDSAYGVGRLYFLVLERVVGRDALLAALRDFSRSKRAGGATFRDLTTLLEARFAKAAAVDADWVTSAAWREKLAKAGSLEAMAAAY